MSRSTAVSLIAEAPGSAGATGTRRFSWRRGFAALLVGAAGLSLAACQETTQTPAHTPQPKPSQTAAPAVDLSEFYQQDLSWSPCEGAECAWVKVPLNYQNPQEGTVEVALRKQAATSGKALGTIFANPGGPGGSGTQMLDQGSRSYFFSPVLQQNFDIIGFDARGVNRSRPAIHCRTDAELNKDVSTWHDLNTPEGRAEVQAEAGPLAQNCLAKTGPLAKYADTVSAIRDMDIMRAATKQDRLNLLGISYATELGYGYMSLFPEQAGRLVLDGMVDTYNNIEQAAQVQAAGFEQSLTEFSRLCQKDYPDGCPLSGGTENGVKQVHDFLVSLETQPLPTNDASQPLTMALATTGVIGSFYSEAPWLDLQVALREAMWQHNGSTLLELANMYNSRTKDGKFRDNLLDANMVINNLSYQPVGDLAQWEAQAAQTEKSNPGLGMMFTYPAFSIDLWPFRPHEYPDNFASFKTNEPFVIISITGDPATPYVSGEKMHERSRDTSTFVRYEGWGHNAYNTTRDACIISLVDNYFLTGKVEQPGAGTPCSIVP